MQFKPWHISFSGLSKKPQTGRDISRGRRPCKSKNVRSSPRRGLNVTTFSSAKTRQAFCFTWFKLTQHYDVCKQIKATAKIHSLLTIRHIYVHFAGPLFRDGFSCRPMHCINHQVLKRFLVEVFGMTQRGKEKLRTIRILP